jgi:hypothetical protein
VRVTGRCLIVVIAICAWIVLSNHCLFAAITTRLQLPQSSCPFHSKPAKPQSQPTECCKILRAVATTPAKNLAPSIVDLLQVDFSFKDLVSVAPPKIMFSPQTLDTGPPGKTSFVELTTSVRANAPPLSA